MITEQQIIKVTRYSFQNFKIKLLEMKSTISKMRNSTGGLKTNQLPLANLKGEFMKETIEFNSLPRMQHKVMSYKEVKI